MEMKQKRMAKETRAGADYLYLLLWHDLIERLDILFLEARHLQISIIHGLREPGLYVPLRHEEAHLWGQDWTKEFDAGRTIEDMVDDWIIPYPRPGNVFGGSDENGSGSDNNGNNEASSDAQVDPIESGLRTLLRQAWFGSGWGRDQRRHYNHLMALQVLKRQMLRDKLIICRTALRLGIHNRNNGGGNRQRKATFLVLRSAALKRTQMYIYRLRDHQNAYAKSLDTGQQDHPKPSVERRREVGIYMDFLAQRTADLRRDMGLLMSGAFVVKRSFGDSKLVLHRWQFDFTARVVSLYDDTNSWKDFEIERDDSSSRGRGSDQHEAIRHVNTSYWMPERPDLQPVIAHEVAHTILEDYFDNFNPASLQFMDDDFSFLIRQIRQALVDHLAFPGALPVTRREMESEAIEVAADLLACSVKGMGYVYALFVEMVGYGMSNYLMRPGEQLHENSGNIDLGLIDSMGIVPGNLLARRQWVFRIRVVTEWMKVIHHREEMSALDNQLLGGINRVLDDLTTAMDALQIDPAGKTVARSWAVLAERLVAIVKDSDAGGIVRQWRKQRSEDDGEEVSVGSARGLSAYGANSSGTEFVKGPRIMPRSMGRLKPDVSKFLIDLQIGNKTKPCRPLANCAGNGKEELEKEFARLYFGLDDRGVESGLPLYRHLYDIPWQSALMRAKDLLDGCYGNDGKRPYKYGSQDVLKYLHFDMPLGRELFMVALEFFLWDSESAQARLTTCIHLLGDLIKREKLDDLDGKTKNKLRRWCGSEDPKQDGGWLRELKTNVEEITELQKNNHQKQVRDKLLVLAEDKEVGGPGEAGLNQHSRSARSARVIDGLISILNPDEPAEWRMAERLAGYKLRVLNEILHHVEVAANKGSGDASTQSWRRLMPMKKYLNLRRPSGVDGEGEKGSVDDHKKRQHKNSVEILSMESSSASACRELQTYVLGRLSLAGSYAALRAAGGAAGKGDAKNHEPLIDVLKRMSSKYVYSGFPGFSENEHQGKKGEPGEAKSDRPGEAKFDQMVTLGRWDLIWWGRTRPLCRCPMPYFGEGERVDARNEEFVSEERFPTFFSRRELALRVNVGRAPADSQPLVALIVVMLQRRTYRLDFLSRLAAVDESSAEDKPGAEPEPPRSIDELGGVLGASFGYLTDGWGDVVLAIHANDDKITVERLNEVFKIQSALYQDFMVDRTELIFSPAAADIAVSAPASEENRFRIRCQIRMVEDRLLRWSEHEFANEVRKRMPDFKKHVQTVDHMTMCSTPGRMDYSLRFEPKMGVEHAETIDFYHHLLDLTNSPELDRMDTNLAQIVYPKHDEYMTALCGYCNNLDV